MTQDGLGFGVNGSINLHDFLAYVRCLHCLAMNFSLDSSSGAAKYDNPFLSKKKCWSIKNVGAKSNVSPINCWFKKNLFQKFKSPKISSKKFLSKFGQRYSRYGQKLPGQMLPGKTSP